ncbi:cell cycle checkpoint protein [Cryptococcus wingfieldii CBS 7118]|uniref:Cell cycle checkpoint protein n=1 Tax=Cryptococcus wingfieldii CBS 7118 TaxID=1295528 RepID=A0A1E3JCK5_9TREE|nr:cell cycle checkpoint protein [Cryptococcus wingfieldii CBS 7118]ODN98425.1 cell cycle checkpoint protein [Cryptococcus wingfieldii CBS 7118]
MATISSHSVDVDVVEEGVSGTSQMWTELYCPTAESDLAPGKARVQKIKGWLHEALFGYPPEVTKPPPPHLRDKLRKYRRILFLTGPAGAGKTTTLKLLAQQMDVDVDEWGEGVEEWGIGTVGGGGFVLTRDTERESSISKFASFIDRDTSSLSLSSSRTATPQKKARARIILLTALPNLSHPKTMEGFHASLLRFCQRFSTNSCPMVIIHSDAGQSGRAEDSWMDASRDRGGRERGLEILGKGIKDGAWCQEIDFIPIAPTFMFKALFRILTLSPLPTASHPAKATLQLICQSSNGDLRAAINSLQMLCGGRGKIANGRGAARGKGKGRGQKDEGHVLRAVLDAVTRKEQSLNLFHALGKVFYNKRLGDPNQQEDENQETLEMIRQLPKDDDLPSHLKEFTRRKSLVQMETFIPSIPLDASSFALWVHQSLPSFCEEIEQVSQGLDYLVESDAMRTDDDIWQSQPQTIQYALQLTLRGAAMSLPSPVPRGKAAHHKVVKPTFFSEWKKERESLGALESAGRYLERRGVKASNGAVGGTWGGLLSRKEMICEMVPVLIKIQNLSGQPLLPVSAQPATLPNWTPVRTSAASSQSSQSRFTQSADELTAKSELAIEDESLEGVLGDWDEVPGHVVNEEEVTGGEEPKQGIWDDEGIRNEGEEEAQFIEDDDIVDDWD